MAAIDVTYRRGRDGVWHHCQNCGGWPAAGAEEHVGPPSGDTCPECYVLDRAGGCTYLAAGGPPNHPRPHTIDL